MKKIAALLTATVLIVSCKNTGNEAGVAGDPQQATIDSLKMEMEQQKAEMAKQRTIDSMNAVAAARAERQRPVIVNNTPASAPEEKRKGWSGAAKGAVIGAGVGAVSGALIDKDKPGRGAVIGGLAGGGLGAGTGAVIDSEKKKKEAQK
ncbi:YMGG-like glycine zipper-containing protein [Flavobacterium caeni]|uniref:YMGG-like Gly-zipper domain-containing protein n=1 Tax=Flavobacterium caeni TaxID=490189 RepID=A0A1G5IU92_9FLAO|nr:hypothetical protein [Flavobacterium caeni]SCY79653.1 hypothetical protein SAMN02927903_02401 [Flavobacterium caeni]